MKPEPIDAGQLRGRVHVTPAQGETLRSAILRGMAELVESCPESHFPRKLYVQRECERAGRETSRRLFLTCIYYPRD